ncbi:MAG: SurA N-terminal domain-containing protein [Luteolibacter sp.]
MKFRQSLALALTGSLLSANLVLAQPAPRTHSGPIRVNGIAATVNGRVVTENQVSFMLAPIFAQLSSQYPRRGPQFEAKFKEAQDKVIQELVDRQIILDEFKQLGATIRPHLIDQEIKRQIRELYNGDEAKFREELKRSRLTMEGYRAMTQEKMVVQAMRAQQFSDAPPPLPNEIQREYSAVKNEIRDVTKDKLSFQKIFIPASDPDNPTSTPESQLAFAEGLAKEIEGGKDFTELAKAHSRDAYAEEGGVQENVARTDLSPEFAAILMEAPIGTVTGPLVDPQGFTIVKVTSKQYGPAPSLGEVREMIEERVRKKKTSAQYERWIESKRKKAMVKIMLRK